MDYKKPAFQCKITNIKGTILTNSIEDVKGDKRNLIKFRYIPLSTGFFPNFRSVEYPFPIPRDNLVETSSKYSYAGVEHREFVVKYDINGKAPMTEAIYGDIDKLSKENLKLKQKVEELEMSISMLKSEIDEKDKNMKKKMASITEERKSSGAGRMPFSSGFGNPNMGYNSGFNNFNNE